jgi:hypothetical protein
MVLLSSVRGKWEETEKLVIAAAVNDEEGFKVSLAARENMPSQPCK